MDLSSARVPLFKKISFAAPAFALAVVGIPVYVYIPKFHTDVVGIHISVPGLLLLGVRFFDAVKDPFIGVVSDRTQSRFCQGGPTWLWIPSSLPAPFFSFLIPLTVRPALKPHGPAYGYSVFFCSGHL